MAKPSPAYHFDLWAEFLTVTISENISRCQLGMNRVKKVRLSLVEKLNWPCHFKVILDNELVAQNPNKPARPDGGYEIEYIYRCPSHIPNGHNIEDGVAKSFIPKAMSLDEAFFEDAWSLTNTGCIPYLLKQLSFRSVSKLLSKQLEHQGVELDPEFSVQFYDGENFVSFPYDGIKQELVRQIGFYMGNPDVKKLASDICFKHPVNKKWFINL